MKRAADGSPIKRPMLSADQCHAIAWELARKYVETLHHADYHRIVGYRDHTNDQREAEIERAERQAEKYFAIVGKVMTDKAAPDYAMILAELERSEWRVKVRDWTAIAESRRARLAAVPA